MSKVYNIFRESLGYLDVNSYLLILSSNSKIKISVDSEIKDVYSFALQNIGNVSV